MSVPLNRFTRKGVKWDWSPVCQEAFVQAPQVHPHARFSPPSFRSLVTPIVETEVSDYAIAGILSLQAADSEVHPVAFYSRILHNYGTHDKGLLATFEAFSGRGDITSILRSTSLRTTRTSNISPLPLRRRYLDTSHTGPSTSQRSTWYVVRFRPGGLGKKPDSLTRRTDYYLKGEDRDFTLASLQHLRPVFFRGQLASSFPPRAP